MKYYIAYILSHFLYYMANMVSKLPDCLAEYWIGFHTDIVLYGITVQDWGGCDAPWSYGEGTREYKF